MNESLQRIGTDLVGAVVEAWTELRIHRTRVLLSLIGVAVAVAAITSVVGLGAVVQQAQIEQTERSTGRPATLSVRTESDAGVVMPYAYRRALLAQVSDRYGITRSTMIGYSDVTVEFPQGSTAVSTTVVDADYGTMHRAAVTGGRWFDDRDAGMLAPAVVVNDSFLADMGSPDIASHPTVTLRGEQGERTAVVIGVIPDQDTSDPASMYVLPSLMEFWVPEQAARDLATAIRTDMAGSVPDGVRIEVGRHDRGVFSYDPLRSLKILVGAVAGLVMLLGVLSLVNISLVTVKQRIREIGVRRSFGASAGRVFFAVMMESVVATVAAGVVGVMAAVAIVKNPWILSFVASGVTEFPPFPLSAALLGLVVSLVVGAVAGLLPALVAVRVSVIDAIRY
jgi:putative ABC transport system permease protein